MKEMGSKTTEMLRKKETFVETRVHVITSVICHWNSNMQQRRRRRGEVGKAWGTMLESKTQDKEQEGTNKSLEIQNMFSTFHIQHDGSSISVSCSLVFSRCPPICETLQRWKIISSKYWEVLWIISTLTFFWLKVWPFDAGWELKIETKINSNNSTQPTGSATPKHRFEFDLRREWCLALVLCFAIVLVNWPGTWNNKNPLTHLWTMLDINFC